MKQFLAPLAILLATAGAAQAVVGGPNSRNPEGARRSTVGIALQRGLCSGVLIERDLVLTAAHCVARSRIRFVFSLDENFRPRSLPIAAVTVHPSFKFAPSPTAAKGVDLALIQLAQPAPADMRPARIGSFGETGRLTIAGFGVGAQGSDSSAGTLRETDLAAKSVDWREHRLIAAVGANGDRAVIGAGGCRGDSGGPLFAEGSGQIVGIVSWSSGMPGKKRLTCGGLTIGTEIGDQRGWIGAAGRAMRANSANAAYAISESATVEVPRTRRGRRLAAPAPQQQPVPSMRGLLPYDPAR